MINLNNFNKTGTALLLIMLIAVALLTSMTILWRSVSLSYESAMLHYKVRQNFYACESLGWYGLGLIKQNLIDLKKLKSDQKQAIYQGNWPKQAATWGRLVIDYDAKNEQINLQAQLFDHNQLVPIATSKLVLEKNKTSLTILDWQNN